MYARYYAGHNKHMLSMARKNTELYSHQVMLKRRRLHDASLTLQKETNNYQIFPNFQNYARFEKDFTEE